MNLTDSEILELSELCNRLADGAITDAQKARLSQWLATSEEARRYYVRMMGLSASLCSYASEMQVEPPDALPSAKILRPNFRWLVGSLAAAAAVVLLFFALRISEQPARDSSSAPPETEDYVAQLTGSKGCRWANESLLLRQGSYLRKGQQLELAAGFAEITFDSGAQVLLEGPASLDMNSAWDATLRHGTLKANVPPEAMGFKISNPAVEVVDLGTVFTMIADAGGAADVLVLKGMVETSSRDAAGQRTIVLHEKQARHFAPSGVSNVRDSDQKFALVAQTVPLDHFLPATKYVHWSFDEPEGDLLRADAFGDPLPTFDARLQELSDAVLQTVRTAGPWKRALRFNGHLYARASFPGISGTSAHSVAFWVKVPQDAQIPSAYAMVAWGANSRKLGSHPIHIGWNRNATEGTVGVLRTDYGGGFALGATPLRDDRWHHVAVVFIPGEDVTTPVEVKQYVDGRFEGEGKPSPPGTEISAKFRAQDISAVLDALWLGCRIGDTGPRKGRFRGEMDEVCVANRALTPQEIVQLMKNNQPLPLELAAASK